MVKEIIPYTKVNTTSKKFGSYFHVAVKYGRLDIFKHLSSLVENWKTLKGVSDLEMCIDFRFKKLNHQD